MTREQLKSVLYWFLFALFVSTLYAFMAVWTDQAAEDHCQSRKPADQPACNIEFRRGLSI